MMSQSDCSPCAPGYFCNSSALTEPSGLCSPGQIVHFHSCLTLLYFSWISSPLHRKFCSVFSLSASSTTGHFCSLGSSEPSPVSQPYGDVCPMGHFCPLGSWSPKPCPFGSFLPQPGASSTSHCQPCHPGKYCFGAGLSQPTGGWFYQVSYYLPSGGHSILQHCSTFYR